MAWTSTKINPDEWHIRCKHCGSIFSAGSQLKTYAEKQFDTPEGMYYVKCPGCGTEDFLTSPEHLTALSHLQRIKKGKRH